MISRRLFLILTGGSILASRLPSSASEFPSLLDHILLGCNDLDRGVAFVEQHTGVRAAYGGVHPGIGTRNALLSLGERRYLEILAPDPEQHDLSPSALEDLTIIKGLTTPRLIGWAAHPGDLDAFAKKLRESHVKIDGPSPGSRARPDGRVLRWETVTLADDHHGLLPFFIEWAADSVHPSADSPEGCRLDRFAVAGLDPSEVSNTFRRLGIDVPVEHAQRAQLRAHISGPKGKLEVSS